jgi:regulator of telomere elongation helicase 1
VNQAIGRVIRHVQDYGAIILVDDRYTWSSNRSQISKWLRDRVRVSNSCEEMADSLAKFFTDMKSRNFIPKVD